MGMPDRRRRTRGFTMVELMVTIAVAAILLAVAIPSFESVINSNRLATASNEMMAALQTARMESVRRNGRTAMCLSADPQAATPACAAAASARGWIVFTDADKNATPTAAEVLRMATIPSQVRMLSSGNFGNTIVFRPDGMAYNGAAPLTGAIAFCIPGRQPPENIRYVTLKTGSRVAIEKATGANGACPSSVVNDP
jgi:type IV fimbrial biogenesis protein FimT